MIKEVLQYDSDPEYSGDVYFLMLNTGLRRGEV